MSIQIKAKASVIELDNRKLFVFQIDHASNQLLEKAYTVIRRELNSDTVHFFVCSERWEVYEIDEDEIRFVPGTEEVKKTSWWRRVFLGVKP